MTTPRRLTDGRTSGYGCGQSIRDRGPALVLQHSGGVAGFGARNALMPSSRSAVAVIANADSAGGVIDAIETAVLAKLMPVADAPTVAGPAAREMALDAARPDPQRRRRPRRAQRGVQRLPHAGAARRDVEVALRTPARSTESQPGVLVERGGMEVSTLLFTARADRRASPPSCTARPTARCSSSCSAGAERCAGGQPQPFRRSCRLSCRLPREVDIQAQNMGTDHALIKGTLDLLILKVVSLEPMHGWGICAADRRDVGRRAARAAGIALRLAPPAHPRRVDHVGVARHRPGAAGPVLQPSPRPARRQLEAEIGHWTPAVGRCGPDRHRAEGREATACPGSPISRSGFGRCCAAARMERRARRRARASTSRWTRVSSSSKGWTARRRRRKRGAASAS